MKTAATIAVALLWAVVAAPSVHAQNGHQHHPPEAEVVQVAPAGRFATDAPLRKGMGEIRTAVDALHHYEMGHMGPEQAAGFATQIQEQVAYLIANCKLDPKADAALHGIIARLGASAQALKADPADLTAIPPMRTALRQYALQFDDPGWPVVADKPEEAS